MMKLQHTNMRRTLLLVTLMSVMWAVASAKPGDSRTLSTSTSSRRVRGVRGAKSTKKIEQGRRAAKKGGGSSSPSYTGCLNYTSTELDQMWIFEGSAPDCSYVYHDGSSGNGGDSNGTDDGSDNGDGDGDANSGDDGDGSYNGDDSDNGDGDNSDVVVSNEDVANGDGDYDPYDNFDLSQCDTYNNIWLWDMSLSCEDPYTLTDCNCTFAEELMSVGLLTCDDAESCPDDCPICSTCLVVMGCREPSQSRGDIVPTSTTLYIIAAAVVTLILFLLCYHTRRRKQEEDDLKSKLIAEGYKGDSYVPPQTDLGAPPFKPPSHDPERFQPSRDAAGVGGIFPGALAKKSNDSDSETDDGDSLDATAVTADDTTVIRSSGDDMTLPTLATRDETAAQDDNESTGTD